MIIFELESIEIRIIAVFVVKLMLTKLMRLGLARKNSKIVKTARAKRLALEICPKRKKKEKRKNPLRKKRSR